MMDFSDSSWQYCPYTGRSTGAYIIFYQGGTIYHGTHILGLVAKSSAESEYNVACTAVMDLANFRMLMNELLKKDPDIVQEEAPEFFQPQMGQFTYWTSTVPFIWDQFRVHVLGSKTLF